MIEPPEREKLRALLDGLRPGDESACVVRCACDPGEDGSGGDTVVDHIRALPAPRGSPLDLPRPRADPAGPAAGRDSRAVDRSGRAAYRLRRPCAARRKLDRDGRILQEELQERPQDPFILFNLGSIAIERQEWREALELLHRSLAGSAPSDSITRKLYALIARAHQMLHEPEPALAACAAGLATGPERRRAPFSRSRRASAHRRSRAPNGAGGGS